MSLHNCVQCGQLILTRYEKRCKPCTLNLLHDSRKVKDYMMTNPRASLLEVYQQTGVALNTIKELMYA